MEICRHSPLKITDVIGSGLPTFFLGRFLADSTTTRNMAANYPKEKGEKKLKSVCAALLPHHWGRLRKSLSGGWREMRADHGGVITAATILPFREGCTKRKHITTKYKCLSLWMSVKTLGENLWHRKPTSIWRKHKRF